MEVSKPTKQATPELESLAISQRKVRVQPDTKGKLVRPKTENNKKGSVDSSNIMFVERCETHEDSRQTICLSPYGQMLHIDSVL